MEALALEVEGLALLVGEEYLPVGCVIPDVSVEGSRDFLGRAYEDTSCAVTQLALVIVLLVFLCSVEIEHHTVPIVFLTK